MLATGLPAADMLRLPGETSIKWAQFDPDWYLVAYPAVRDQLSVLDAETILQFHLQIGQQRGYSPNLFFDEGWYRLAYRGVAAEIREGRVDSAFDSYCRAGFHTRSPHWLFDPDLYRVLYPDLTKEALAAADLANLYDHYLAHGAREMRQASIFFDPALYRDQLEDAQKARADEIGPFQHYLNFVVGHVPEFRTTLFFDPIGYANKYKDVADAIAYRKWQCALHHYLANDTPTAYDPLPEFSEAHYLGRYPDVAAAVERHDRRNGYQHFLQHGAVELRSPAPAIELRYYAEHDEVKGALYRGEYANPFHHYLGIGRLRGLPTVPLAEEQLTEAQAKSLFRRKAVGLLPLLGRGSMDFTCQGKPDLSAIVVAHNGFTLTLMTLASLRANHAGAIELIVVDRGSTDDIRHLDRYVRGASIVRLDADVSAPRCRNAALNFASADVIVFLGQDLEFAPGAIRNALHRLASDPEIGAVGAKLLRSDGMIGEAGGMVWGDGATAGYLSGVSALAPETNFLRNVDFVSSAFVMTRLGLLQRIEGFDDTLTSASCQDADLCLRIAAAGPLVVYDPSVIVYRHGPLAPAAAREAAAAENDRPAFCRKHAQALQGRPLADAKAALFARFGAARRAKRILFVEDTVPLRTLGAGFVRSNDIVRVLASLGYQVTIFPINDSHFDAAAVFHDMPDAVEVMYDRSILNFASFLNSRKGYYDLIWVARTHNLNRIHATIEHVVADEEPAPRVILDTEAVESPRDAMRAALQGQDAAFDLDGALRREFAHAALCDAVVAVSPAEALLLREVTQKPVSVVGHMRPLRPTPRNFQARAGMLFIGAIHDVDTPNYDALCWFVDHVLPLVEQALKWQTRLTVAGYVGPKASLERFRDHPRVTLRGEVSDTEPLYDQHRLFVAPTRYAAGAPYKVYEAASFGLPVVGAELLCRQMGWEPGQDMLVAGTDDPALFAEHVVRLYRDAALWQDLRDNALARLQDENNEQDYVAAIRDVVEGARVNRRLAEVVPESGV